MGPVASSQEKGGRAAPDATPLVAVGFVLLIAFLAIAPLTSRHLTAHVPEVSRPDHTLCDHSIVVTYRASGALLVNGDPVAPEALAGAIADRLKHDRFKTVFFDVDDDASYGRVVRLMDLVRGAGAKILGVWPQG